MHTINLRFVEKKIADKQYEYQVVINLNDKLLKVKTYDDKLKAFQAIGFFEKLYSTLGCNVNNVWYTRSYGLW